MPTSLSLQKEEYRNSLLRSLGFSPKTRALILLDISNSDIQSFLQKVGEELNISFVVSDGSLTEKSQYLAFDGFISDEKSGFLDMISLVQS